MAAIEEIEIYAKGGQEQGATRRTAKMLGISNTQTTLQKLNWLYETILRIDTDKNVKQMDLILHNWVPVLYRLSLACNMLSADKIKKEISSSSAKLLD